MQRFVLRAPQPADESFIINSWLKSIRDTDLYTFISNDDFYHNHLALIRKCLDRALVTLAVDEQDLDHIYGYMVFEPDTRIIHCLYIKKPFRNFGIAKSLVMSAYPDLALPITFTHIDRVNYLSTRKETAKRSSAFIKLRATYPIYYNPYLFYGEQK
jgi:GNAT superfamily N-acetyltransferase